MNKLPTPERFHNFTLAMFFSLLVLFPSIPLEAVEYRFTKIADTTGGYSDVGCAVDQQPRCGGVCARRTKRFPNPNMGRRDRIYNVR